MITNGPIKIGTERNVRSLQRAREGGESSTGMTNRCASLAVGYTSRAAHVSSLARPSAMLRSLAALLIFQCLGESVSYVFSLPVPGPVIGMLLLFAFALMRPAAAEAIEPTALELLRHLSLLFIPAGVGIMVSAQAVRGEALAVIASLVVSTTLGIAVTALVTRALLRRQRRNATAGEGTS